MNKINASVEQISVLEDLVVMYMVVAKNEKSLTHVQTQSKLIKLDKIWISSFDTDIPVTPWISIETMPPIAVKPERGDPDLIYMHTDDVMVLCSNGDIHRSYHDGDVWCYHNLSGCPQWDVTHWQSLVLPEGSL